MQELSERNYFTDYEILKDPYSFFEALRAHGPIYNPAGSDIMFVTGFKEVIEVLNNRDDFSSAIAPQGPAVALPFEVSQPDLTSKIEDNREKFVGGDLLVAYDDQQHTYSRSLLTKLFTPSRLRANEEFMADFADRMIREVVTDGKVELMLTVATPFVTIVIADLLGVPQNDRALFMEAIEQGPGAGNLDPDNLAQQNAPLVLMGMYFAQYVKERRANPTDDVLSELSHATYPDGSLPDLMEIVRLATFLFAAGQDTSAKLLGNAMRFLIEQPGLQDQLRADLSLIPPFLEEVLRLEGSTKITSRIARRDAKIGGTSVPIGTKILLALSAANRDPDRWEDPAELKVGRPRIKEHVAFGRGAHVCAGAPLARVEVRVLLETLLKQTSKIEFDEEKHGPAGARKLDYEPTFIIRGLSALHLKLIPSADFIPAKRDATGVAAEPIEPKKRGGLMSMFSSKKPEAIAFSTANTKIGEILAHPEAKSIIDRHFPGVSSNPKIGMGKGMTFRTIQKFAPDLFSAEALDQVDAEFIRLGPIGR